MHLEGAVPLDALWELICKYGGDPGVADGSQEHSEPPGDGGFPKKDLQDSRK